MINCPSSWRDIPVPENRLLLVKARTLIISYSGTDISYIFQVSSLTLRVMAILEGKGVLGCFFYLWWEPKKPHNC